MFFEDCVAALHRMDAERRRAYLRWLADEQYFKLVALHDTLTRKEAIS